MAHQLFSLDCEQPSLERLKGGPARMRRFPFALALSRDHPLNVHTDRVRLDVEPVNPEGGFGGIEGASCKLRNCSRREGMREIIFLVRSKAWSCTLHRLYHFLPRPCLVIRDFLLSGKALAIDEASPSRKLPNGKLCGISYRQTQKFRKS